MGAQWKCHLSGGRAGGYGASGNGVGLRLLTPSDCPSLSQGQQLSTESLQQLLERALTPLVDEVKQRGLAPACPSCQRLHKKILVPGTTGHHAPLFGQGGGRGAPDTRMLLTCGRMGSTKHHSWQVLGEHVDLMHRGGEERQAVWWVVSHRSVIMGPGVMDLGPRQWMTHWI